MRLFIVFCGFAICFSAYGAKISVKKKVEWSGKFERVQISHDVYKNVLTFHGASYDPKQDYLPVYSVNVPLGSEAELAISLAGSHYEAVTSLPQGFIGNKLTSNIAFTYYIGYVQKKPIAYIQFVPLIKGAGGNVERLTDFELSIDATPTEAKRASNRSSWATSSVLSTGTWYKVAVGNSGVFKMDYNFLKGLGISVDNIDPRNIHVYGNGGGMLPEANSGFRHDDLVENPIIVSGESDGVFNTSDFVLFYAQGPHTWALDNNKHFEHQWNIYSNNAYYFIKVDGNPGKRISSLPQASNPTATVTSFDDRQFYHTDQYNLVKSGRTWYGDLFNFSVNTKTITFDCPNIIGTEPVWLNSDVAAASTGSGSSFSITCNGLNVLSQSLGSVSGSFEDTYATVATNATTFTTSLNPLQVNVTYNYSNSQAQGWLNFVDVNCRRGLTNTGNQMGFRDVRSVGAGNVSRFVMQNADGNTHVLDVTDPTNAQLITSDLNGTQLGFTINTSTLHEFFVYQDNGSFPAPTSIGTVNNQNLHGITQQKMIIVTNSALADAANTLASYHRTHDALKVAVVDVQQIYNEFSSGAQDITAIRDFVRMLYNRAGNDTSQMPKYLMLMGRASYDYKNIVADNTNIVPVYESYVSNDPVGSYCTDDFFGFLDDNEGDDASNQDKMDIAIGRMPFTNVTDANNMVNKIIHYTNSSTLGDWRNSVTFAADDGDGNSHFSEAEDHADFIEQHFPAFNVDKIYLDAFPLVSTPAGDRHPDANDALNKKMFAGTLIMNYTGHGGVNGWSHERCLTVDDIRSWTNYDKLAFFVTATCQFTQFDDPSKISAGEEVLLNAKGGAVSMVSTVRLVFQSGNTELNNNFLDAAFASYGNRMPTVGEATLTAKNNSINTGNNNRKFFLFGDPAMTLNYPKYNVVTTNIDKHPVSIVTDTLKALQRVTIKGEVRDAAGNKLQSFNGIVYPTLYDKQQVITTLAPVDQSYVTTFKQLKSIIFKGKASVTAGEFSFTFIVPKDIAYNYGMGKLSYYADNGTLDANGYTNIMVGGNAASASISHTGPQVKVFMNNEQFAFGGLTDANPLLLVELFDSSGINTVGNGIGHDLTGVMDENTKNTYVLNDYYEAALDNFQKGTIRYPLSKLADGRHALKVKAWDAYNNSNEGYTEFVVASTSNIALSHVLNYPNPFTTSTNFQFEHNKPGELLFVQVKIYTVTGKLVKTIQDQVQTDGYRVNNIHWDGLDDYGDKIGRGVYVYKLSVSTPEKAVAHQFEKLVILR